MTVQDNLRMSRGVSKASRAEMYHRDTSALASAVADARKKLLPYFA
jgi:hypothetical protein